MVTKNWDDDKLVAWGYTSILVETRGFLLNGRNGRRSPQKTRGPGATKIGLNEGAGGRTSIWPIKKRPWAEGRRGSHFPVHPSDHVRDRLRIHP